VVGTYIWVTATYIWITEVALRPPGVDSDEPHPRPHLDLPVTSTLPPSPRVVSYPKRFNDSSQIPLSKAPIIAHPHGNFILIISLSFCVTHKWIQKVVTRCPREHTTALSWSRWVLRIGRRHGSISGGWMQSHVVVGTEGLWLREAANMVVVPMKVGSR
jgi:hypothetical protein